MTTNKPTTYWASSAVLAKLESRHNNAPCILTDGPAEFNDVALVRLSDYEALQAECEKLRKDAERYVPLNEAVQRAATELPEGWEIQLCVMRDSGWVDLIGPDGTEDFYTDNERLDYTVIDMLSFAKAIKRDNPC